VSRFFVASIANLASRHRLGPDFWGFGCIFAALWGFHATLLVALSCPAPTLWMVLLRVCAIFPYFANFGSGQVSRAPGVGIHLIEMLAVVVVCCLVLGVCCFVCGGRVVCCCVVSVLFACCLYLFACYLLLVCVLFVFGCVCVCCVGYCSRMETSQRLWSPICFVVFG
jgi:hypothetical protein